MKIALLLITALATPTGTGTPGPYGTNRDIVEACTESPVFLHAAPCRNALFKSIPAKAVDLPAERAPRLDVTGYEWEIDHLRDQFGIDLTLEVPKPPNFAGHLRAVVTPFNTTPGTTAIFLLDLRTPKIVGMIEYLGEAEFRRESSLIIVDALFTLSGSDGFVAYVPIQQYHVWDEEERRLREQSYERPH